jgi:hypothetical protein
MKSRDTRARKANALWLIILILGGLCSLVSTEPLKTAHADEPAGGSIRVEARGNGWDVYVKFHVRKVTIPQVIYQPGNNPTVNGSYPQPYITGYDFQVDNALCGGDYNPVTNTYQYPNAGQAVIEIYFPEGTFSDPTLPGITEITVIRRSPCGEDGPINFIPEPVIEFEDVTDIAISIWERIELPELEIDQNPGVGIVTVPAWFWLKLTATKEWWKGTEPAQGGQPFGVTVTIALPNITHSVQVLADADWLLWDFGDKSVGRRFKQTNLVGKEYPLKSNVTHWYNGADTYEPNVTIHYVPRYAWNGGGFTRLPDEFRESLWEGEYRVREAQTMLIAPRELNPDEK